MSDALSKVDMPDLMLKINAALAFADFVAEDRGINNLTQGQVEVIADHAVKNLDKIVLAYELGILKSKAN